MGLFHRKVNSGRRVSHPGLRFRFDPGAILLASMDIAHEPELVARAPLWQQLRGALVHGAKPIPALARELGAKENTIEKTLRRYPTMFVQLRGDTRPYPWRLAQS
jgi:hypothetical protein